MASGGVRLQAGRCPSDKTDTFTIPECDKVYYHSDPLFYTTEACGDLGPQQYLWIRYKTDAPNEMKYYEGWVPASALNNFPVYKCRPRIGMCACSSCVPYVYEWKWHAAVVTRLDDTATTARTLGFGSERRVWALMVEMQ